MMKELTSKQLRKIILQEMKSLYVEPEGYDPSELPFEFGQEEIGPPGEDPGLLGDPELSDTSSEYASEDDMFRQWADRWASEINPPEAVVRTPRDMVAESVDGGRGIDIGTDVGFVAHLLLGGLERHLGEEFSDDAGYEIGMDLMSMLTYSDSPNGLVQGLALLARELETGNYAPSSED
jgi:hypothetical protein